MLAGKAVLPGTHSPGGFCSALKMQHSDAGGREASEKRFATGHCSYKKKDCYFGVH